LNAGWPLFVFVVCGSFRRRRADELAGEFDAAVAAAIGQQSVMADFDEPRWQDVQQELIQGN